eukprot:UN00725
MMFALTSFLSLLTLSNSETIEQARALTDEDISATVTGQLTSRPGVFADYKNGQNGAGFYIQDDTGGMLVYVFNASFYDSAHETGLVLGRFVTVTGTVDTNRAGVIRINPTTLSDIEINGEGIVIDPTVITPTQISDYQGQFVRIENLNVSHLLKSVSIYGSDYRAHNSDDEGFSIYLYPIFIDTYQLPIVGQQYEYVQGIAAVFANFEHPLESEWELWPRSDADLKTCDGCVTASAITYVHFRAFFVLYLLFCFVSM